MRSMHAKDKLLSPVDPDARQGKKSSTTWPGYKAHIVMEEETGIITGVETTPANVTDGSRLKPCSKNRKKSTLLNRKNSLVIKLTTGEKIWNRWIATKPSRISLYPSR